MINSISTNLGALNEVELKFKRPENGDITVKLDRTGIEFIYYGMNTGWFLHSDIQLIAAISKQLRNPGQVETE